MCISIHHYQPFAGIQMNSWISQTIHFICSSHHHATKCSFRTIFSHFIAKNTFHKFQNSVYIAPNNLSSGMTYQLSDASSYEEYLQKCDLCVRRWHWQFHCSDKPKWTRLPFKLWAQCFHARNMFGSYNLNGDSENLNFLKFQVSSLHDKFWTKSFYNNFPEIRKCLLYFWQKNNKLAYDQLNDMPLLIQYIQINSFVHVGKSTNWY